MDIQLDDNLESPLFVQIAQAIIQDIRRGRLASGARLPGSRALAETVEVHRNTVLAAYAELTAEGWITSEPARGTFVSEELPEQVRLEKRTSPAKRAGDSSATCQFSLPVSSSSPHSSRPRRTHCLRRRANLRATAPTRGG